MVLFPYQFFYQVLVLIPHLLPWLNDEKKLGKRVVVVVGRKSFFDLY